MFCLVLTLEKSWSKPLNPVEFTKDLPSSALGLGLLPPRLVSTTAHLLWIGAAIEERFYQSSHYTKKLYAPHPEQLNELLDNCPYKEPRECLVMVSENLKLDYLVNTLYKLENQELRAKITFLPKGDSLSAKTIVLKGPANSPSQFIISVVEKIYQEFKESSPKVYDFIEKAPSQNLSAYGCFALGYRYIIHKNYKKAFYPLERALELDSNFVEAQYFLSLSHYKTGRIDSAIKKLNFPYDAGHPISWQIEILKANLLLKKGKSQQAFESLKLAKQFHSEPVADLEFAYGNYYKEIGAATRGISYVISAIHVNPSVLEYYLTLGELYSINGDYQSAIPYFQKLVEFAPSNKMYRLYYGITLRESNNMDEAISIFSNLLSKFPDFYPARINLGICYQKLGWLEKAQNLFKANVDLDMGTVDSYVNLAALELSQGKSKEIGKKYLELALKDNPEFVPALVNLGALELNLKNYQAAERYFKKAMSLTQADTVILLNLSQVYSAQKKVQKEYELLNKILELDPENVSALTRLAYHAINLRENTEAINYLMEIIDQNPSAYRQRLLLAKCFIVEKDDRSATEQWKYVAEHFTNSPDIQLELSSSYFENKYFKEAIDVSEKLLRYEEVAPQAQLILGKSFTEQIVLGRTRRIGADSLANFYLEEAVKNLPRNWECYYYLAKYKRLVQVNKDEAKMLLEKALLVVESEEDKALVQKDIDNLISY